MSVRGAGRGSSTLFFAQMFAGGRQHANSWLRRTSVCGIVPVTDLDTPSISYQSIDVACGQCLQKLN